MSAEAMKVNELLGEAAHFTKKIAEKIREFVQEDVLTPEFLNAADEVADNLDNLVDKVWDLSLDEETV